MAGCELPHRGHCLHEPRRHARRQDRAPHHSGARHARLRRRLFGGLHFGEPAEPRFRARLHGARRRAHGARSDGTAAQTGGDPPAHARVRLLRSGDGRGRRHRTPGRRRAHEPVRVARRVRRQHPGDRARARAASSPACALLCVVGRRPRACRAIRRRRQPAPRRRTDARDRAHRDHPREHTRCPRGRRRTAHRVLRLGTARA